MDTDTNFEILNSAHNLENTMDTDTNFEILNSAHNNVEQIAATVATLLTERLTAKDLVKLFHLIFLEVSEAAQLLRVKERTVYSWISQGRIPVRYANGKPIFLLPELLNWTLPEGDKYQEARLT